jgi:hypothetical protein
VKRHVAVAVAAAAAAAACSRTPAPREPTERALFRDLERQVTIAVATGWGIDRIEVDKLMTAALDTVCRVDVLGRRGTRAWLDAELQRLGGPVDEAWRRNGKRLSKVSELLVLHRARLVLERADELSPDCPFWVEPETPFRGRQISENTWQLTFGGGGKASAIRQGDRQDLSFGGAGRLLFGRTFHGGDAIYVGLEVGASAEFPKDARGERTALELGVDVVAPIVYRRMLTNTYFELEAGWLGHSTEEDFGALDHGIHVGVAFGGRALRQRFLFPGAAFGISWERLFLPGQDLTSIKVGARVAFDLDLWR